mmetsp:Transcript_23842/g.3965  ORF Transcript_23842/g.3965 Transcript_23842/m.3965 type:complete len:85 (+) Transcript_23842:1437-1691(+)
MKIIKKLESTKVVAEGTDAMLATKHLGWNCASCTKNLEKLQGRKAAYYAWNRMPFRDPVDHISRVGPGFSRMLASVNPEQIQAR